MPAGLLVSDVRQKTPTKKGTVMNKNYQTKTTIFSPSLSRPTVKQCVGICVRNAADLVPRPKLISGSRQSENAIDQTVLATGDLLVRNLAKSERGAAALRIVHKRIERFMRVAGFVGIYRRRMRGCSRRRNLAAELSEALMNCNFAAKGPDRP
jgi:hypothetical protein